MPDATLRGDGEAMATEDTKRGALYYPHIGVGTTELLKMGLLLWDDIEYISPSRHLVPDPPSDATRDDSMLIAEGMELLLKCHVPTDDEKDRAHQSVEIIVNSDLGARLRDRRIASGSYEIYAGKFDRRTWELLRHSRLAAERRGGREYATSGVLGLVMMSVLADACAGSMKRLVTDQDAGYETVRAVVAPAVAPRHHHGHLAELVDVTLRVADVGTIPLKDLVEIRRREEREGAGSTLTALRRSLAAKIDATAQAMTEAQSSTDRTTIRQQFEADMEADFARLAKDLRAAAWKVVFSKELVLGVLFGAGLLAIPGAQAFAGGVALGGGALAYRRERAAALEGHPMSWLHVQH